ncbi:hypothetical protein COY43_00725 [Candidatus Berkelbacteria bacterium CG_4_10_14_0_8_um_filter_35_9_33_8]|uniref:YdbS-like PH domain-containing protein n=1 Tax=Candidatus Berkelbacteria bacterium CG_4_10_14_0_2_um_filter_35_9_33_12 TaxID=1974499 RepID=A0A2M7W3T7_9BACT|nr:MAG: hypothetical protein COX10_02685 [Candidatus Berkelbacteria bacterium CG23_combo_of_CG06-09_8_20_14_all_33_15]PIS08666.1 MAG: hypothetical protein COT76_00115 [Candidatus Berkelbacteria bacterium CG10_big_fil_rev_8_21_14_0_10_33_10]PIZ28391.1 MAG: hypothetical protein COY43_00725 [Candidatus Berkelbacteria bacterium CG_4_10_14_0_8_um_filter_35_9_33_8]PJA20054.1 MAG: hypothetical protein COX60_02950 [Candidatus Berkelbacteria bacterium CG_4_10_14_0_2_um_filter_35_9_33_12]PJB52072.1 MAG: 
MLTTFENITYDESIIIKSRRHVLSVLLSIIVFVILSILPVIIVTIAFSLEIPVFKNPNINILLLLASCYYMIYLLVFTSELISYYYDLLLVTNSNVISIDQSSMFSRKILQFNLEQIEDINVNITGFIPTFFNFGNIIIQTAGTKELTVIKGMPNPQKIASKIMELRNIYTQN